MQLPYYFSRVYGPRLKGKVLNVGLGDGFSARAMLSLRGVTSVYTIERNLLTILDYQTRWTGDPLESRHTIINGDIAAIGTALNAAKPFDLIFIDTIEDLTDTPLQSLRTFLTFVKTQSVLAPGGVIQIQYQSDTPFEREFRNHWMQTNFKRIREDVWGIREGKVYYQLSS